MLICDRNCSGAGWHQCNGSLFQINFSQFFNQTFPDIITECPYEGYRTLLEVKALISSDNVYVFLYVFACVYFPESVCMSSLRQWSRTMVRTSGLQNFTRVVIGTAVNYLFLCEYEKNAKVCILGVVFKFTIHCTMCGFYSTMACSILAIAVNTLSHGKTILYVLLGRKL